MRITQGTFSYLPDFDDDQIRAQVQYCLDNDWPVSIEYTDDPHPRNVYWDMWGMPMFDIKDAAGIMLELNKCREVFPNHYLRIDGSHRRYGRQTTALSFIVNRPKHEPGFRVDRMEFSDRQLKYSLHAYSTDRPTGERYEDS